MGIAGASGSLRHFALNVARPALEKKIAKMALTKTAWYLPMKETLRVVGVQVTKQSLAGTVTKVVPLVGGVMSGSLTYVTFNSQAKRLMQHLRELPTPNVDAAEYMSAVKRAPEAHIKENKQTDNTADNNDFNGSSAHRQTQGIAPAFKNTRSAVASRISVLRPSKRYRSGRLH